MNRFLVEVCRMQLNYLEFKFNRVSYVLLLSFFFGDFSLFLNQIWQLYFLCSQGVSGVRLCVPSCSGGFFPLLSPLPLTFLLLLLRWVQTAPCSAQTTLLSYSDTLLNLSTKSGSCCGVGIRNLILKSSTLKR